MKVVCVPHEHIPDTIDDDTVYFSLYHSVPRASERLGHIAPTFLSDIHKKHIRPSIAALDFATMAFSIAAADESIPRSSCVDGWTRMIDLTVALIDPEPWHSILESFQDTLRFLSGDYWTLHVIEGGVEPEFRGDTHDIDADCVCLLSGGTDSLIGAIDLVEQGNNPIYISRTVRGDCVAQRRFAHKLGVPENHYQWGCSINRPRGMSEQSTRARSLVFFAFAVIAASAFAETGAPIPIIVPENGFISLNIPMTPSRIGSLSTKTTHPIYMKGIQKVMDALGINAQLQLPYRFKTKGEMIVECRNQTVLRELIDDSISCGKYRRHGYKHCGVCVPCLVRRAAYLRAGIEDNTRKGYDSTPSKHNIPEDTMAAASAIIRNHQEGTKSLISGALVFSIGEDRTAYEDVFIRGLGEIEALLKEYGVL